MFDTQAVTRELVRALRGDRSQTALNRRLRYESNVTYLWESGRRYPTLSSAFWLAHRVGVELDPRLDQFQRERSRDQGELWTIPGAAALLRDLQGRSSAADIARQLGCGRHTVARWLRGETEPHLPDVFTLVQLCTMRALDFVALFVDPATLPSASEAWAEMQAARRLVTEHPWSLGVMLALELDRYRALGSHEAGWIARNLGIPDDVEHTCIRLLVAAGQVRLRNGLYERTGAPTLDVTGPERNLELRQWWATVSRDRTHRGPGCSGAWNLFTASDANYRKVQELQREYFRALRILASETGPMDHLVLANMQLVVIGPG